MPITVTAPRGTLTPAGERDILPQLTAALIEASGQTGNAFFRRSSAVPSSYCRLSRSTRAGLTGRWSWWN